MLPSGVNVTEAALQRIGIEERASARRLESNGGHPLRHLGDLHANVRPNIDSADSLT
jgi:hypothetical protein